MRAFIGTVLGFAVLENIMLTMGFGASVMLRTVRRRSGIPPFGVLLAVFTALTAAVCYPLDQLVGGDLLNIRWFRPLAVIAVTALLYGGLRLLLARWWPAVYERVSRLLPLAAFNNLVIGTAVMVYLRHTWGFWQVMAAALGASAGFLLLSWLTIEGMERMDNPDMPKAFRGLPSILVYLGLLALATMGFR